MKANDNEMSELQRVKALETVIAKTRLDLKRVEDVLKLTPTNVRLKKQKGAIEKVLFKALA
jgi:hypothetical protein